ncbi:hypothetical protein [Leptospira sp. GIMC2001]|uniref:hypothetical protein n=1 Tax=Leptospira sp. GIMC2001 TaxID=1513297 RepID=UPI00234B2A09|nr:hypothetical protein [Leptospira sp. GIMC2001]WCL48209.1 hypothetical protein O4O04_12930 [Leptospira sp. GIMC2001]
MKILRLTLLYVKPIFQSHAWILISSAAMIPLIIVSIYYSKGFNWPDEIFQTMELAYHIVTGRGNIAWEFKDRARSVLYPQMLSIWIRFIYLFSKNPIVLFNSTRAMLAAIYFCATLSIAYYYLQHSKSESKIFKNVKLIVFSFIYILFPLNYYFGFRTLTESITTSIILFSIFLIQIRVEKFNQNILIPGFLLGLTYGLRFQMAIFFLVYSVLLIYKLWTLGLNKAIKQLILGLIFGFSIYLISDFVYYGMPFISSINYFKVNILEGVGAQWGTSPFYFYFEQFNRYLSALLLFLIPGIYFNFKKFYPIIVGTAAFILVHSMVAHKELRFIFFSFPIILFFIISGIYEIFNLINQKFKKLAIVYLVTIIISTMYLYSIILTKKIQWNFLNDNLQLFLQAERNGVNDNSLITIQDTFAWGAGYVYLGPNFTGDIFFKDMNKKSNNEIENYLTQHKIINILIKSHSEDTFCETFGYCKTLLTIGEYSWIKKVEKIN